jgi:hypothetical protein
VQTDYVTPYLREWADVGKQKYVFYRDPDDLRSQIKIEHLAAVANNVEGVQGCYAMPADSDYSVSDPAVSDTMGISFKRVTRLESNMRYLSWKWKCWRMVRPSRDCPFDVAPTE